MGKKIIGKFDKNIEKIEFYEIVDEYKQFTIIKRQGNNKYYAWDNKKKMLSEDLHIITIPSDKKLYEYILDNAYGWHLGEIFFWADSKFVTDYGLPHYSQLKRVYKELLKVKASEIDILKTIEKVKETENYFTYLRCKWYTKRYLNKQNKTTKKMEKEFKLIW